MRDPLALDATTMRALGHRTVDALVELLTDPATPCLRRATAAEMEERLPAGTPEAPARFDDLLGRLREDVVPFMSRLDHPGYFAFIPACGTFPSALGDFIASALNPYVGTWMEAAGPTRLELVVLDWFRRWIGYPPEAAGVLVSGGSAANMTALACAREALLGPMTVDAVAYVSDQGHSSLARAARLLGFRPDQVRVIPTRSGWRLRPEDVAEAIGVDAAAGRRPLFVAAAAGTTNTGAIDPLAELARVCREHGVWLHVDGSYGGFAALTTRGREALRGIEEADSVALDPHKWLYQPFECGSLLVRDGRMLRAAFEITPDYLSDAAVEGGEVNFADRGLQLSRGSRALKVWLSVSFFGLGAFRAAIDRCLDLARLAEEHVAATPALEVMSPASLGIVCFRRRWEDDGGDEDAIARRNAALVAAYAHTGAGLVSSTRLHGRYAIRMCVMNHTSAEDHVRAVLDWFARAEVPATPAAPRDRRPSPHRAALRDDGWLAAGAFSPEELAALALFRQVGHEDLERVGRWARETRVAPGDAVVRRWEAARDFYVIVEGRAIAEREGRAMAELGPGDFFGELAALDWGAGYAYARQATVRAIEPLRLLVLAPGHLGCLMADAPAVDAAVRRAARERLAVAGG